MAATCCFFLGGFGASFWEQAWHGSVDPVGLVMVCCLAVSIGPLPASDGSIPAGSAN